MNLFTTLTIVVTTKPFSKHKYMHRALDVPRADAIKDKPPTRTETIPSVITCNPTLPNVSYPKTSNDSESVTTLDLSTALTEE